MVVVVVLVLVVFVVFAVADVDETQAKNPDFQQPSLALRSAAALTSAPLRPSAPSVHAPATSQQAAPRFPRFFDRIRLNSRGFGISVVPPTAAPT